MFVAANVHRGRAVIGRRPRRADLRKSNRSQGVRAPGSGVEWREFNRDRCPEYLATFGRRGGCAGCEYVVRIPDRPSQKACAGSPVLVSPPLGPADRYPESR